MCNLFFCIYHVIDMNTRTCQLWNRTEPNKKLSLISIFKIFWNLEMATKGSDQPKGAKSAYIFFSMAARPTISQANPDMKPTEVTKVLGKQWKCLDKKQNILKWLKRTRFGTRMNAKLLSSLVANLRRAELRWQSLKCPS